MTRSYTFARCSSRRSRVWFPPSLAPDSLATLSRSAADAKSARSLAAFLREGHRRIKQVGIASFISAVGVDQALGSHNLVVDDLVLVVHAIGAVHVGVGARYIVPLPV